MTLTIQLSNYLINLVVVDLDLVLQCQHTMYFSLVLISMFTNPMRAPAHELIVIGEGFSVC